MEFGINWNDGYEVCDLTSDENNIRKWKPLRNFGDHQGAARIFKEEECPDLSDAQIKLLIKNFKREVKYQRIGHQRYRIDNRVSI